MSEKIFKIFQKFKPLNDLNLLFGDKDSQSQCFWIEILDEKNINILLGVYYGHPKKI